MFYPIHNTVVSIDEEDLPLISCFKWYKTGRHSYAGAVVKGKTIYMARLLMGFPDKQVDHINRNKLDNRKSNLRVVDNRENCNNKPNHGMFGPNIQYRKDRNKFTTKIRVKNYQKYLGIFPDPLSAEVVYKLVREEIDKESDYYC